MKNFSAKNKILLLLLGWLVLALVMFFYLFKILDGQNQATLDSMADDRKNLVLLEAQDKSYKQAQADLQELAKKSIQPEDFFSKDVALVNEIQTLESLANNYNVKMTLSGVSGTVGALPKAATASSLAEIPYGITLQGDFFETINFIESLENLPFVTNVTGVSIGSADRNNVVVSLSANFYLRK